MRRVFVLLSGIAAAAAVTMATVLPVSGADHGDAPLAKANHAEDIADVYAFAGSGGNVVLAMTVNPLTMPGDAPTFDAAGLYQFHIDNTGDAVPDVTYNVTFGAADGDGVQDLTIKRATGADADSLTDAGTTVVSGKSTGGTDTAVTNSENGVKAFAGLRDDPFFFDLNAFNAGLAFRNPGNNFFAGLNVSAIVLEVPKSDILADGSTKAGVWAVTSKSGAVIDRMGRPAIATVFIPADQKDAFNNTKPAADVATWKSTVVASLNSLGSDPALADALLPDVLTFDTSMAFGFLNGRKLADDVIDAELQLITGNAAASDNVANDSNFGSGFPYLSAGNTAPAPTAIPASTATAAAPANTPAAAPTARPSGVTAPNTGTGDGSSSDSDATMWVVVALAGAAVIVAGGAVAVKRRG